MPDNDANAPSPAKSHVVTEPVSPPAPPECRKTRRPVLPWLLVVILLVGLGVATFVYYGKASLMPTGSNRDVYSGALVEFVPSEGDDASVVSLQTQKYAYDAKSAIVLEEALRSDDMRATSWYEDHVSSNDNLVDALRKAIRVNAIPGTSLISITTDVDNELDRPFIINSVAKALVASARTEFTMDLQQRMQDLSSERDDMRNLRDISEAEIRDLMNRGLTGQALTPKECLIAKIAILYKKRQAVQSEYQTAFREQDKLAEIAKHEDDKKYESPVIQDAVNSAPEIQFLQQQRLAAMIAHKQAISDSDEDSATAKAAKAKLKAIEAVLKEERKAIAERAFDMLREHRKRCLDNAKQQYLQTESLIDECEKQLKTYMELEARIEAARGGIERANAQLRQIDKQLLNLRIRMKTQAPLALFRSAQL